MPVRLTNQIPVNRRKPSAGLEITPFLQMPVNTLTGIWEMSRFQIPVRLLAGI